MYMYPQRASIPIQGLDRHALTVYVIVKIVTSITYKRYQSTIKFPMLLKFCEGSFQNATDLCTNTAGNNAYTKHLVTYFVNLQLCNTIRRLHL